ncbi:MAG: hypothetical protein KGL39_22950 [Patescibacteria group bacterium]|nr:hypothetical protein [Patescibacteria group bacterium]
MPRYTIQDGNGRTIQMDGDTVPSADDIQNAFAAVTAAQSNIAQSAFAAGNIQAQPTGQPSQFSSGLGPGVPAGDNADFAFTQATGGGLPGLIGKGVSVLNDKVLEPVASGILNQLAAATGAESGQASTTRATQPGQPLLPDYLAPLAKEKGILPALTRALQGFTTPGAVLTLPFAAESKPVQAFYLASAASAIPPAIQRLTAAQTPDEQRDAATELAVNTLMAGLMHKQLTGAGAKPKIEAIKALNDRLLTAPLELHKPEVPALQTTATRTPNPGVSSEALSGLQQAMRSNQLKPETSASVPPAPQPEPPATIAAQIAATKDPTNPKAATLLTPGEQAPPAGHGLKAVQTEQGTLLVNPDKADPASAKAQVDAGNGGQLLGMSTPAKPAAGEVVVQTKTPAGVVVQEELASAQTLPAAIAAGKQVAPGGSIELPRPEQVIQERQTARTFAAAETGKPFAMQLMRGEGATESPYASGYVPDEPILGPGRWTTPDEEYAKVFGPNITQHEVQIRNPLVIRTDDQWRALIKEAGWKYANPFGQDVAQTTKDIASVRKVIERKGHDGVVIDPSEEGDAAKTLWDVFGAKQAVEFKPQAPAAKTASRPAVGLEKTGTEQPAPGSQSTVTPKPHESKIARGSSAGARFAAETAVTGPDILSFIHDQLGVEDGRKFGTQRMDGGQTLYVERVEGVEGAPDSADFLPPEKAPSYRLDAPESVDEQQARLAREAAQVEADKQRAKLQELQNKKLIGRVGDIGQKDMFGGGDLLSEPMPEAGTSAMGFPAAPAGPAPAPAPGGVTMIQHGRLPVALDRTAPGSVSVPQIMDAMHQVLRVAGSQAGNIRTGHFFQRARGIWKPHEEIIRLGDADNIPTATHEIGHGLQQKVYGTAFARGLKFLSPPIRKELIALGKALYGSRKPAAGYTGEGFAEFMRYWLTTEDAGKVAPAMNAFFEKDFLTTHPAIAKALQQARDLVTIWRNQGSLERARRQVMREPGQFARMAKALWQAVSYQAQFESGAPIEAVSKAAAKRLGRPLRPSEDPYLLYSFKRGSAGATVERMATKHMLDVWGNPTGPSLEQALGPVKGQRNEFLLYLFARRAIERWGKGKNPGIALEDAQHIKALYDKPEFQLAAQHYYDWWDGVLNYVQQADPTMADVVNRIRAGSSDYAPLARMIDPLKAKRAAAIAGSNPMMRMFGSGLPVKDIFDQTFQGAARLVSRANRALVTRNIVRLANLQGLGHIVEEIPRDRVAKTVNFDMVRQQLEDLGLDTSGIPEGELLQYYTHAETPRGSHPIVAVKDGTGTTRWYQVDPRLYDQLETMQTFSLKNAFPGMPYLGTMLDLVLGAPSRAFRLGTTGLRPAFSLVTNPTRDIATLLAQTQFNPAKVAAMYPAALLDAIRGGTYKNVFYDLGAHLGQPLGTDIGHTQRVSKELFHGRFMRVVRNPVDHLRELLSITESAPRLAELRAAAEDVGWQPGQPITPDQAVQMALAAKRVTVDFSAAGDLSRVLNQAIPFYNPGLQGARAFARAFAKEPRKAALLGLMLFTGPALATWWQNKDKAWYRALPWRERYIYTHIDDGKNVWQIPRPFEWGNAFMVVPEMALDSWYRHDPEAAKQGLASIFDTQNPLDYPVLLKIAKEQWQNNIAFWDRPIVPRSQVDLPPAEQVGPYTTKLAIAIGKAFPQLSPRRIDAAVRSYFGGVGSDIIQLLGLGPDTMERQHEAADFPIFGTLVRRGGQFNAQNQHVNDFWDAYLAAKSRVDAYHYALQQVKAGQRSPASLPGVSGSDAISANIGAKYAQSMRLLNQLASRTADTRARSELYRQIDQLAVDGLNVFKQSATPKRKD